ncbi:MAG: rhaR 8 [Massilibacillus sp.]|jgi:AraC-like DNA-binding protein|nr:rhaR 8 [Massilibacillus sp.]
MRENAAKKYQIFNPHDEICPICAELNHIYASNLFHNEMQVPATVGEGYCRRIVVKPSMKISISDITFYEKMTIGEKQGSSLHSLAFCLGEGFLWRVEGNPKEYGIACGESCIFNSDQGISISSHHPGSRFLGICVEFDFDIITSFMQHKRKDYAYKSLFAGRNILCNGKTSPGIRLILNDMMNCRYREHLKKIYLEGKILELVAVYLDEAVFEDGTRTVAGKVSAYDREALYKARNILDENLAAPPTLGKLAKLICLNEYKLKTGFKELFGLPVHAYIIDKRLELARLLIEDQKLRVTEAALLVGYNDLSYFAEKFRGKYGVNPSQYSKNR